MTRRQRHERIIAALAYDPAFLRYFVDGLRYRRGLAILTDEAIEELAADIVRDRKFSNKLNAANRARRNAR